MKSPTLQCLCCGSSATFLFETKNVTVFRCSNCGSLRVKHASRDVNSDPWNMTSITPKFLDALAYRRTLQAKQIIDAFAVYLRKGRLLDYGCGQGRFVDILKANKFDASGCDISDTNVALPDDDNWFIRLHTYWEVPQQRGFYTISLLDVLEHSEFPGAFIDSLKAVKPKQFLIKVPMRCGPIGTIAMLLIHIGRYGLMERLLLSGEISPHYTFFSSKGLVTLFNGLGYNLIKRRNIADVGKELPDRLRSKDGEPQIRGFIAKLTGAFLSWISFAWSDTAVFLFEYRASDHPTTPRP